MVKTKVAKYALDITEFSSHCRLAGFWPDWSKLGERRHVPAVFRRPESVLSSPSFQQHGVPEERISACKRSAQPSALELALGKLSTLGLVRLTWTGSVRDHLAPLMLSRISVPLAPFQCTSMLQPLYPTPADPTTSIAGTDVRGVGVVSFVWPSSAHKKDLNYRLPAQYSLLAAFVSSAVVSHLYQRSCSCSPIVVRATWSCFLDQFHVANSVRC